MAVLLGVITLATSGGWYYEYYYRFEWKTEAFAGIYE